MKKVLADNIMNLEDYLLTASARHKYSELLALSMQQIWFIHDRLIEMLKATIE